MPRAEPAKRPVALVLLFATLGATASAVPATLPARIALEAAPATAFSAVVPALFTGVLAGVLLSMVTRGPAGRTATAGALLQAMAFGVLALATAPAVVVVLAGIVGLGFGLVESAATALVRDLGASATPRRLAALTGTVAVVAAALPLLVASAPVESAVRLTCAAVAALAGAAAIAAWRAGRRPELRRAVLAVAPRVEVVAARRPAVVRVLASAATALALAVGAESLLAGHSAVVPFALLDADPSLAALGTSAFWVLLAAGRFAMAAALRRGCSARTGLICAALLASLGFAVASVAISPAPLVSAVGLAVAALGLGPIYSLVIGMALAAESDARARRTTALLIAAGAVGGSALPTLLLIAGLGAGSSITYAVVALSTLGVLLAASVRLRGSGGEGAPSA